jgi:glutamate N-acetyltransferase/amino-acid N-acetyltransferase
MVKEIEGGVCAPVGFKAGGICCGIKAGAQKRDLALVASDHPCTAAAVFTGNLVKAANILVSREHLEACRNRAGGGGPAGIRAFIANSGNANACTGEAGLAAARRMAALTAERLGIAPEEVAVASTGVIGVPLPVEKIEAGMGGLAASLNAESGGAEAALEAIMTTDTRKKFAAVEFLLGGTAVCIGAMVKGSGMIHPNMATMIGVITTDAAISGELLDKSLRRAVNRSFNRLTVDGDMSTNDMVLVMANGAAGNNPINGEGPDYEAFTAALEGICVKLTRAMARDGEGAARLVTVTVRGAAEEDAAALARSVAGSSLVKAACFGADANWGRVLCALGYAGVKFDPAAVSVYFASQAGRIQVCRNGASFPFSEEEAKKILLEEEIEIEVELEAAVRPAGSPGPEKTGAGDYFASAYGCDLTYDYVKINGDYRS